MKFTSLKSLLIFSLLLYGCTTTAQPSAEDFKATFVKQLQQLLPSGFEKRTVKIVQVTPGKSTGGNYSFKVTAYIHDYDEGYAPNKYYGQTCLGKMDNYVFNMRKDDFGEWLVQGRFTVPLSDVTCKDNTAQGAMSITLESVPGSVYQKSNSGPTGSVKTAPPKATTTSSLYIGEYASYGTGNRSMAGMGFTLLAGGRYYDLDKQRGGSYVYDMQKGTISFKGGFLDGQIGRNVKAGGFDLSATVYCEPYK